MGGENDSTSFCVQGPRNYYMSGGVNRQPAPKPVTPSLLFLVYDTQFSYLSSGNPRQTCRSCVASWYVSSFLSPFFFPFCSQIVCEVWWLEYISIWMRMRCRFHSMANRVVFLPSFSKISTHHHIHQPTGIAFSGFNGSSGSGLFPALMVGHQVLFSFSSAHIVPIANPFLPTSSTGPSNT